MFDEQSPERRTNQHVPATLINKTFVSAFSTLMITNLHMLGQQFLIKCEFCNNCIRSKLAKLNSTYKSSASYKATKKYLSHKPLNSPRGKSRDENHKRFLMYNHFSYCYYRHQETVMTLSIIFEACSSCTSELMSKIPEVFAFNKNNFSNILPLVFRCLYLVALHLYPLDRLK